MSVHTTPQDAYWKFFESLNARDAAGWAGVMSYPHVRVSPEGAGKIFRSAEEYAADALWEPVADAEMVRTQGLKPTVVHEEVDKVHLAGGWTRFRPDGDPQWFTRPNEANTPAQVLSIENCGKTKEGIVDCNGVTLPYLSPSNDVVKGSTDLYDYWVRIGQAEEARLAAESAPGAGAAHGDEL